MKKLSFALIALVLIIASCSKSSDNATASSNGTLTVEKKNHALLMEFSETWCGPCGTYGIPSFDTCFDLEGNTISMMKICSSSTPTTFNAQQSAAISKDYGIVGVPTFLVNGSELNLHTDPIYNKGLVISGANAFALSPVVAGVAMSKTFSSTFGAMIINTRVQFFAAQPAGKDYRLSLFVVEDKLVADQNTITTGVIINCIQRNVLRNTNNVADYKGYKIDASAAAITVNQTFDYTYNVSLFPAWNRANLKVIGVIYDCTTPGKPVIVNTSMLVQ